MKPNVANLFASLIVDQWPMPDWIRNRIQSHPAIADAIESARVLESRLGEATNPFSLDQSALPKRTTSHSSALSGRIAVAGLAIAAVLVIFLYGFNGAGSDSRMSTPPLAKANTMPSASAPRTSVTASPADKTESADVSNPTGETIDLKTLLVSLAAAQNVLKEVSQGLKNVAGDFAEPSIELETDFKFPLPTFENTGA
jgi:hypothetical protein